MRIRAARTVRIVAVLGALTLIAAACSSDGGSGDDGDSGTPTKGGSAVFGAEQWPQCLNPITSCAFASWYSYTIQQQVMPRLVSLDTSGNYIPDLATEVPSLENGMITEDPFTVTFNLDPEANWEDGTPITSEDIEFTWLAQLNTPGAISTVGYQDIESMDTSDPKTVVMEFSKVYVDWAELFGGGLQFVLKKAAFPDADADKPDLSQEMQDEVPFSGGPWILDSWDKSEATLSRNDAFWGQVPYLDQVSFVRRQNQSTEINSLKSGEVDAIFPQPSNVSLIDQFADTPAILTAGGGSPFWEAIHFNHEAPPLDDQDVREGIMYALNRDAVNSTLVKINAPESEVLNCYGWLPTVGEWCDNTDFAEFTYDPEAAKAAFERAGYDCSSTPCEKDGEPLTIEYVTTAGNDRREDTQALLKEGAVAAGLDLDIKTEDPTFLFSNLLPKGEFQMTEFAFGGSPSPSVTSISACDQIPTEENDFSGQNNDFWCNEDASKLMAQSDEELDPNKRLEQIHAIGDFTVEDRVGLPMYVLPQLTAWRSDKIAGPIDEYNETIYSSFFNMNEWYLVGGGS
ncbi:MAG: peptide ABC transporter substrate-binding protein [Actinomycetota bacterium]